MIDQNKTRKEQSMSDLHCTTLTRHQEQTITSRAIPEMHELGG